MSSRIDGHRPSPEDFSLPSENTQESSSDSGTVSPDHEGSVDGSVQNKKHTELTSKMRSDDVAGQITNQEPIQDEQSTEKCKQFCNDVCERLEGMSKNLQLPKHERIRLKALHDFVEEILVARPRLATHLASQLKSDANLTANNADTTTLLNRLEMPISKGLDGISEHLDQLEVLLLGVTTVSSRLDGHELTQRRNMTRAKLHIAQNKLKETPPRTKAWQDQNIKCQRLQAKLSKLDEGVAKQQETFRQTTGKAIAEVAKTEMNEAAKVAIHASALKTAAGGVGGVVSGIGWISSAQNVSRTQEQARRLQVTQNELQNIQKNLRIQIKQATGEMPTEETIAQLTEILALKASANGEKLSANFTDKIFGVSSLATSSISMLSTGAGIAAIWGAAHATPVGVILDIGAIGGSVLLTGAAATRYLYTNRNSIPDMVKKADLDFSLTQVNQSVEKHGELIAAKEGKEHQQHFKISSEIKSIKQTIDALNAEKKVLLKANQSMEKDLKELPKSKKTLEHRQNIESAINANKQQIKGHNQRIRLETGLLKSHQNALNKIALKPTGDQKLASAATLIERDIDHLRDQMQGHNASIRLLMDLATFHGKVANKEDTGEVKSSLAPTSLQAYSAVDVNNLHGECISKLNSGQALNEKQLTQLGSLLRREQSSLYEAIDEIQSQGEIRHEVQSRIDKRSDLNSLKGHKNPNDLETRLYNNHRNRLMHTMQRSKVSNRIILTQMGEKLKLTPKETKDLIYDTIPAYLKNPQVQSFMKETFHIDMESDNLNTNQVTAWLLSDDLKAS